MPLTLATVRARTEVSDDSTLPPKKKQRRLDFVKCTFCRKDKQKCLPSRRQWPGEKCSRCIEKNLPCSEPEQKQKASEPSALPVLEPDADPGQNMDSQYFGELVLLIYLHRILCTAQKELAIINDRKSVLETCFELFLKKLSRTIVHEIEKELVSRDERQGTKVLLFALLLSANSNGSCFSTRGAIPLEAVTAFGGGVTAFGMQLDDMILANWLVEEESDWTRLGDLWARYRPEARKVLEKYNLGSDQFGDITENIAKYPFFLPNSNENAILKHPHKLKRLHDPGMRRDCLGRTLLHILLDSPKNCEYVPVWASELVASADMINAQDIIGRAPLHIACQKGCYQLAETLIENGADVYIEDEAYKTPLNLAANAGHKELCELILTNPMCDIDDWKLIDMLDYAIRHRQMDIMELLLKHVTNFEDRDSESCTRAFLAAVYMEDRERMMSLGALPHVDMASLDFDHGTPLHFAVKSGYREGLLYLLSREDVDANKDHNDQSPLMQAVRDGSVDMVGILSMHPAVDVNFQGEFNEMTPLTVAAARGHTEIVRMLALNTRVNVSLRAEEGKHAVHYAAVGGHHEVVNFLAGCLGVNVNCQDDNLTTPLMMAAAAGKPLVVETLLKEREIDIAMSDIRRRTALHHAACQKDSATVQLLIQHIHVDVNARDRSEQTPMMLAVSRGTENVVRTLMAHSGVQLSAKDLLGNTVFERAQSRLPFRDRLSDETVELLRIGARRA